MGTHGAGPYIWPVRLVLSLVIPDDSFFTEHSARNLIQLQTDDILTFHSALNTQASNIPFSQYYITRLLLRVSGRAGGLPAAGSACTLPMRERNHAEAAEGGVSDGPLLPGSLDCLCPLNHDVGA
eukprot:scaffold498440_cov35-Prasinocladus_malaysianus.AAC.1